MIYGLIYTAGKSPGPGPPWPSPPSHWCVTSGSTTCGPSCSWAPAAGAAARPADQVAVALPCEVVILTVALKLIQTIRVRPRATPEDFRPARAMAEKRAEGQARPLTARPARL